MMNKNILSLSNDGYHYLISQIGLVFITVLMFCMSGKTIAQSRVFVNPGLEFGATNLSGVTQLDANYGYGGEFFDAGSPRTSPWYTTHSTSNLCVTGTGTQGNCHPIEVWASGYLGFAAAEGNNFVELNAEEWSMIYQLMYLTPGDVIKGSFKHRARNSSSEQARWVIEDQYGTGIAVIATTTVPTVTNAWRTYTGNYTFTGAPGIYRVGFRAVTGGTLGNFLDDIQIFTNPIIDLKNSIALSACEGNSNGTLFLRINGRVESNTTVAVELQNPNNGNAFASPADITLTPVANSLGTASITRSGNIYLVTIPPGDYDGGITPGYSSPSNNEDGVRININSVSDAINEPTETFRFEIKSAGTNGSSSNFSAGAPVSGDFDYLETNNYFISDNVTIVTQPNATQNYTKGTTASPLTVVASNPATTYQWYRNNINSNTGGTAISGATTSSYTPPTSTQGTFYYYVVVGGTCGQTSSVATVIISGENYCTTGCNNNTYVNAVDPNTIEYDNIVSVFHATIIKEKDGVFKGWGEGITPSGTDQLTPIEITPANGYNYTGTPLHATGTSIGIETSQFALLTTTGLYSWGRSVNLLFPTSIKNSKPFAPVSIGTEGIPGTKADGLPAGVTPQDVKMMYGTHGTLAIVTCTGDAWVLSFVGAKSGNGSTSDAGNNVWKRVKTSAASNLNGVVALRGSSYALMALTETGKVYTWGRNTYLGDNSAAADRLYATEMILPSGATPKMIGLTRNVNNNPSYFLLARDGNLYTMGMNNRKQLGDGTTTDRLAWVQPQKPASQGQGTGPLTDIAWISPNEHDGSNSPNGNSLAPFHVLTNQGKLWAWGFNDTFMIGGPAAGVLYDPLYMPGGLDANDKITAVETGGHTTMIWKDGGTKFGYVGHRINGSMADGVVDSEVEPIYSFQTAEVDICGVPVTPPTNFCTTGCNNNTYVNAVDPNTIEYDNIIGLYHSTIAKEADGTVKIWGQGASYNGTGITGNILTPQIINSTNYPGLTGDILRFAGASRGNNQQFSVLTTTGLFVWGDTDILVPTDVKNSNVFGSIAVGTYGVAGTKADGLPAGVAPGDVKMMFGTERTLSLVTCSGEAWMLSRQGYLYGDGTTDNSANDMVWHRVSTSAGVPLTNVVAARGAYYGMMALTSNGEIYTWGRDTRLGNNTAPADRLYATLMEKPSGVTPKMIGMTYQYVASTNELTYYLLGTNGNLYSMGANHDRQLGNGTTTASDSWINVTATDKGASLGGNVVWISPNEHDSNDSPSINVLTTDAKLWAWGHNHAGMLDGSSNATINPTYMPGSITGAYNKGKLNLTDKLIAVETGGHTSITIKECSTKFGYVGHRVRGSMADGTTGDNYEDSYNFSDTSALAICGALTGPVVEDLKICVGQTADLADAVPGALPPGVTIEWWTTIDKLPGTQVTNPSSVPAGTYYAFYVGANPVGIACPSAITIDNAACACYKPGLTTGGDVLDTKVGITSLSRAGADNPDNWPMIRKGGWIALESKTKGFVPNRVAFEDADSDPATPDVPVGIPSANFVEGMMVYDTTNKCMKMYTLKEGDTSMAWHCIATQTCPD